MMQVHVQHSRRRGGMRVRIEPAIGLNSRLDERDNLEVCPLYVLYTKDKRDNYLAFSGNRRSNIDKPCESKKKPRI
jgi:hypothetical protein